MIDEAVALYEVDPSEFVAARTRLVRELKAAKRRDEAAAVVKLPRPRMGEHLLNLAARSRPEAVRAFAAAVTAATAAQSSAIGSGDGAALRSTSAELRSATSALIDATVSEQPARRDEVLAIVRGLTNEHGVAQLVAGVVGSGTEATELDLFAGAPEPHDVAKKREPKAKRAAVKATDARQAAPVATIEAAPSKAELAKQRRRQADVERATVGLTRAQREVAAAQRAVDAATARLTSAEAARQQAAAELDTIRDQP